MVTISAVASILICLTPIGTKTHVNDGRIAHRVDALDHCLQNIRVKQMGESGMQIRFARISPIERDGGSLSSASNERAIARPLDNNQRDRGGGCQPDGSWEEAVHELSG